MEKLRMTSPDLTQANIEKLADLFPTVVTESVDESGAPRRAIDFDLLRQELADHIVEGPQERYQLDWPGKRAAAFAANAPIAKTLRPVREESVDFDTTKNLFIEGDNLDALKLLQESYLGKVKLIYIDPPYNTGNDFVYEDDFGTTTRDYLAESGQVGTDGTRFVANTESNGRFHSDWLSMMLPRLKLARTMLSPDGVIFISIDDHEVASLRKVADDVFGERNFVASAVWQKRTSPEARKRLAAGHEYVLVYARDASMIEDALSPLPLDEKDRSAFSNPDNDPRGPWVSSDFTAPGYRPNQMYAITTPSGAVVSPPPGRCWMNLEDEYNKQVAEGRFWYGPDGTGIPRRKTYLAERNGKSAWTWWPNSEVGHTQEGTREVRALFDKNGETFFDFPKPVRLIERVVQLATRADKEDVVVDFFAGSGTTAHAVMSANLADGGNRRFVLVQMPELLDANSAAARAGYHSIADISRDRVRRAGSAATNRAVASEFVFDFGFRSLRIDTTNMTDLDATADDLVQASLVSAVDSVKPDRTNEDLLFQVLLSWGLDLSLPIQREALKRERESVDFDATKNVFIEGDNLDALKLLQESYLGKVNLIYIDPPYNTGNDFVYEDDFAESSADYLARSGQKSETGDRLVANTEASGRFHSDWLSMVYPRMKLARSMLTDDGVAIVAIADHEHGTLRLLLDEVFGRDNFLANVVWQGGSKNDARFTSQGIDYMLIYARNVTRLVEQDVRWTEPKKGHAQVMELAREVWDASGHDPAKATPAFRKRLREMRADLEPAVFRYDQVDEQGRPFRTDNLAKPSATGTSRYDLAHPVTGLPVKMPREGWRFSPATMAERIAQDRVIFGPDHTSTPALKRYLDEMDTQAIKPVFTQERASAAYALKKLLASDVFPYTKDVDVLAKWISAVTQGDRNAVIMDFFAGSGSTGHAVMKLNAADGGHRRFILVQLDEAVDHPDYDSIADVARERLRRAGTQLKQAAGVQGSGLDVGFRSLHVATTNMADTLSTADDLVQIALTESVDSVKPDRTDEDLLFQVLLDWGLDLAAPIIVEEVAARRVLSVDDDTLIASFADDVTDDLVKTIAARHPLRAVFLDVGFATDAARINAEQIFREVSPETEVRTI